MKPTRNIVKPNNGLWKTKGSVWYQKNDDDKAWSEMNKEEKNKLYNKMNPEEKEIMKGYIKKGLFEPIEK